MAMNSREKDIMVKALAVNAISNDLNAANATQIGDYTYVIPVTVEGEDRYAKIVISSCLAKDTKTHKAFDLNSAVLAYKNEKAERAEKAAVKKKEKEKEN